MAKTIAKAKGNDYSRTKEVRRLGSESSEGQANTWRTFVTAFVRKDGSGYVEVNRDGQELHYFKFEAEQFGHIENKVRAKLDKAESDERSKANREAELDDAKITEGANRERREAEAESDDDREIKKTWTEPDALDEANEDVKDMSNEELKARKDENVRFLDNLSKIAREDKVKAERMQRKARCNQSDKLESFTDEDRKRVKGLGKMLGFR